MYKKIATVNLTVCEWMQEIESVRKGTQVNITYNISKCKQMKLNESE